MNSKVAVLNIVASRRQRALNAAKKNLQIALKNKKFRHLYEELKNTNMLLAKAQVEGKNFDEFEIKIDDLTQKLDAEATCLGLDKNSFKPQFVCKMCCDTGVKNGKDCECVKQLLQQKQVVGCTHVDKTHTFENSNLKIFDNFDEAQTLQTKMIEWANSFPLTKKKNIVLCGGTGAGKTFLAECIANKLIKNNVSVAYYSSFAINNLFLKFHTTFDNSKAHLLDDVLGCDVLIIDDLGSEPKFKNVSEQYFYLVANERFVQNKSIIVTTNLSLDGILDCYGERTFSRLCNKNSSILVNMSNSDLRLKHQK